MTIPTCEHCGTPIRQHWEVFWHAPVCQQEKLWQQEFQRMEQRNRQRQADLRLLGTGLRVTHADRSS